MRKVRPGKCPGALNTKDSLGAKEIAKAIAFFGKASNKNRAFPFAAYKNAKVKESINEVFFFKCAYCESRYAATAPVDVEHWRPKAAVNANGRKQKPGYYWLAAKWNNLLASCIFCNRENKQTMPDNSTRTTGKGNNFPVADEAKRATKPGDEKKERPLLLNPYRDDPDKHLVFDDDGIVRPYRAGNGRQSVKGQTSIDVYGLLRRGLVQERASIGKDIAARIERIENLCRANEDTPNPVLDQMIRQEMAGLKGLMEPDQPYSTMARQLIESFIKT
jgi:uncharacterized protein (TIGR02646 family)